SANERAERSSDRATAMRIRASKEFAGSVDEVVDFSDFFPAITYTCRFLDFPNFVGLYGNARVGVPSILGSAVGPAETTRGISDTCSDALPHSGQRDTRAQGVLHKLDTSHF